MNVDKNQIVFYNNGEIELEVSVDRDTIPLVPNILVGNAYIK